MSYSSKAADSTTSPSTPLSPFPSTPHRLSYIQHQPFTTNTLDSPIHAQSYDPYTQSLTEHISPTKAAQTTRLNHEISTLTAWLETLFDPKGNNGGIPPIFQKWKGEVLSAATQGSFDGPVPLLGAISPSKPAASGAGSGSIFDDQIYSSNNESPIRPTQQSRRASTTTNTTTNNPVLEQLKTLKQVNLSADYLATLLHNARLEELHALQSRQSTADRQREQKHRARTLLDEVYSTLTPDAVDALRSLSESAVTLGIDLDQDLEGSSPEGGVKDLTSVYAQRILSEVRRKFMLEGQVRELNELRERIEIASEDNIHASKGEDTRTVGDSGEIDDGHSTANEHIHAQTAQFNRDTKQINLKIMEYHDRVTSLERQLASLRSQSASLQDVLNARARVEDRRARVRALQERFAAFNGLPPDLEDSRNEVRRAMAELETLKRRREGLFERMGTG